MSTTAKWAALGTETVVMTNTNLSALANNALFLSAAYNNVQGGGGGDGFLRVRVRFTLTMAVAAAANTGFTLWILTSTDGGTTYEDGGTAYTPLQAPDCVCPAPVDTTQRNVSLDIMLPPGFVKFLLKNDGTGQSLKTDVTSTGSQLSITPLTYQDI